MISAYSAAARGAVAATGADALAIVFIAGALVLIGALGYGLYSNADDLFDDDETPPERPAERKPTGEVKP